MSEGTEKLDNLGFVGVSGIDAGNCWGFLLLLVLDLIV